MDDEYAIEIYFKPLESMNDSDKLVYSLILDEQNDLNKTAQKYIYKIVGKNNPLLVEELEPLYINVYVNKGNYIIFLHYTSESDQDMEWKVKFLFSSFDKKFRPVEFTRGVR